MYLLQLIFLPKWDTAVGDYATYHGILIIKKTQILISVVAEPHKFHQHIVAYRGHMATQICVNTCSGNGFYLMAHSLSEPMLTSH